MCGECETEIYFLIPTNTIGGPPFVQSVHNRRNVSHLFPFNNNEIEFDEPADS